MIWVSRVYAAALRYPLVSIHKEILGSSEFAIQSGYIGIYKIKRFGIRSRARRLRHREAVRRTQGLPHPCAFGTK